MEHELLRKLRSAMAKAGHDALVAFSQDNVTYTAGFLVPSHASNRFRRTITVLAGETFAAQIVVNVEENLARQRSRFSDIRPYNQFTEDPADLLADALLEAGVGSGQIAIELDYMPAQDYIRLRERLPAATFVPSRELYFNARMVKTDEEIAVLDRGRPADRSGDRRGSARDPAGNDRKIGRPDRRQQDAGGRLRRPEMSGRLRRAQRHHQLHPDRQGDRTRRHRPARDPRRHETVSLQRHPHRRRRRRRPTSSATSGT